MIPEDILHLAARHSDCDLEPLGTYTQSAEPGVGGRGQLRRILRPGLTVSGGTVVNSILHGLFDFSILTGTSEP